MLTDKRKAQFNQELLDQENCHIGFIDVGSGGPLKLPWSLLPSNRVQKFNIEPTDQSSGAAQCISNIKGRRKFFVANDERASSLHQVNNDFVKRFNAGSFLTKSVIDVECLRLDDFFQDSFQKVDLLDINTEGHDFQVLQGAEQFLEKQPVKLIKIECQFAQVWDGQGWFSDIDQLLRSKGFDLVKLDVDNARPANASYLPSGYEPLWGKAFYIPTLKRWSLKSYRDKQRRQEILKAVLLYVTIDLPGRAFEMLELAKAEKLITEVEDKSMRKKINGVYQWLRYERYLLKFIPSNLFNKRNL